MNEKNNKYLIYLVIVLILTVIVIPFIAIVLNLNTNNSLKNVYLYTFFISFFLSIITGIILQIFNVFSLTPYISSDNSLLNTTVAITLPIINSKNYDKELFNKPHYFIHQMGITQQGLLTESINNLGMIILSDKNETYGIIVPIDENNNPLLDLNTSKCNKITGCLSVNLTKVLSQDQKDIIGTYIEKLPECSSSNNDNCSCERTNKYCKINTSVTHDFNCSAITLSNDTDLYKKDKSQMSTMSHMSTKHSNTSDCTNVNIDDNLKHDDSDKNWDYKKYNDSDKNHKYKAYNDM
jgi:hypothetical protein